MDNYFLLVFFFQLDSKFQQVIHPLRLVQQVLQILNPHQTIQGESLERNKFNILCRIMNEWMNEWMGKASAELGSGIYLSGINEVVIAKPIKPCIFYERLHRAERWKCQTLINKRGRESNSNNWGLESSGLRHSDEGIEAFHRWEE